MQKSFAVLCLLVLSAAPGYASIDETQALAEKALQLQEAGNFAEAESTLQRAVTIAEKDKVPHIQGLCYQQLGRLFDIEHKYDQAGEAFQKGLSVIESVPDDGRGLKTSLNCDLLSGYADVLIRKGDYEKAEKILKQSLELARAPGTSNNIDTQSSALTTLALLYSKQRKYDQVIDKAKEALALIPKMDPAVKGDAAELKCKLLQNLADAYANTDQTAKSEQSATEALQLCESHPDLLRMETASCYRAIGVANMSKRDFAKGVLYLQKAVSFDTKFQGPDSSFVAIDADTLGLVLVNQRKFPEAKAQFEKAMSILKKSKTIDPHLVAAIQEHIDQVRKLIH